MSATDNDLQVSRAERKVAFATAADAEYKLADGRVGVRSRFMGSFSFAHLCCAASAYGGREGESSYQSHQCLE